MARKQSIAVFGLAALAAVILGGLPTTADAGPIIFASSDSVLFRIDGATIDMFSMPDVITGMSFDSQGSLWATSPEDLDQDGFYELYRVTDPFGTPGLSLVSDGLIAKTPSIEWYGSTLYGAISQPPTDTNGRLVTIDAGTGNSTYVGTTGETGANLGGITIDQNTGIMYGSENLFVEGLVTIDWQLINGPNPSATTVGPAGYQLFTSGLDFYEANNTLYAMARVGTPDNQSIAVFTVDTGTGAFTVLHDLTSYTAVRGASGIAVIPEPATLSLMALGGLALLRRKR